MRRSLPAWLLLALLVGPPARADVLPWAAGAGVRRALDATRRPVARCVEDYRTDTGPRTLGFIVHLRVAADGSVARVGFEREGPLSPGQRYCVRRTLEALQLPRPRAEQRLPLRYVVELR